jgi:hypothetical protein
MLVRVLKSRTGLSGPRAKGQFTAAMAELRRTLTVTVAQAKSRTLPGTNTCGICLTASGRR